MKRMLLLIATILGLATASQAQSYPMSAIPDSLKANADIVIRERTTSVNIISVYKTVSTFKTVVTILNERGKDAADFLVSYTPDTPITDFSGALYDANGKRIKKIKESDLYDQSYAQSFSLYEETRIKHYTPSYPIYPYTVEYSWESTDKGVMGIPSWNSYSDYFESVEKSSIVVSFPESINVRFKSSNIKGSVSTTSLAGVKTYTYETAGLKAVKPETLSIPMAEWMPKIEFSADLISIGGVPGASSTWAALGSYFYNLQKDRDMISPKLQAQFGSLKGKPILEIAEEVRKYLNENTRYVNISVGPLGGLQTTKASDVEKFGYGDCKALSNFGKALFQQAGVAAYATLIEATPYSKLDSSFVISRFNHVILCVPTEKADTLWMDCTVPELNLGYTLMGNANKTVLVLQPNGGKLGRTKTFGKSDNTQHRKIILKVSEEGEIEGSILTSVKNLQAMNIYSKYRASLDDQRKQTLKELSFANPNIKQLTYQKNEGPEMSMVENLSLSAVGYASCVGKRLFVPAIPMERRTLLPKYEKRMLDIKMNFAYTDVDTIRLELPQGYVLESRPKNVDLKTPFGSYSTSLESNGSTVTIIRRIEMNDGTYPASSYSILYDFYRKMSEADNAKLVIVKQNT